MSDNCIICGVIQENGVYTPIYCDIEASAYFFEDPVMSTSRGIEGLTVINPIEVDSEDVVDGMQAGDFGECIGVIHEDARIIRLENDTTARYVTYEDVCSTVGDSITIDIYGDYDD